MKQHTVPALGLLLSGCAVQGNSQPDVPADNVVDQMIAVNTQKVSFVQQQLIAALTPVLPAPPRPSATSSSPPSQNVPLQSPPRVTTSSRWPAPVHTGTGPDRYGTDTASGTGKDSAFRLDHPLRHGPEAGGQASSDLAGERSVALCA
ncbi:hypothetical protein H6052_003684 [Salmonella enterica]|nr:hypothetical protein [Salmonella enterica subsp. enterica serovar Muenchen]EGB2172510.1 hypothetical protein [Salmonella enterica]EGB2210767.1 hypothetical protein [Salmonella enterica]